MLNDAQFGNYSVLVAELIFNGTSVSWAKNVAYCETTQVLDIDEHALSKSKNEQFRLVVSGEIVNFGINSFSGERTHSK